MKFAFRRALAMSPLLLVMPSAACSSAAGRPDGSASPVVIDAPADVGDAPGMRAPLGGGADAVASKAGACATRRFFVWRAAEEAACADVAAVGGTWAGEAVFAGATATPCAYRWTGAALPGAEATEALARVATASVSRAVVPDCSALPSVCAAGDATCAASAPTIGSGDGEGVAPGAAVVLGGMTTCDSCAVARGGSLYAVITPDLASAPVLVGEDRFRTVTFELTPPAGAQRFAMALPPGTLADGTVVSLARPD